MFLISGLIDLFILFISKSNSSFIVNLGFTAVVKFPLTMKLYFY